LDLGKLTIPKNQWKIPANHIEEILNGQQTLIEIDPDIEAFAQHYASVLISKNLAEKAEVDESEADVKDNFRSMKSELGLRPNYHQKDDRIKGHLFMMVLAHHVVNAIQKHIYKNAIYMGWKTIRELLSLQHRVTTEMNDRDGKRI